MGRITVFDTPGLLDLRAITCIGVNTKPHSVNPIGFFGTGLKYAVAILVREGMTVTLLTGGEAYNFYRKTEKFRDKDFDFIRMKRELMSGVARKAQYSELSYTTEFGKTWKLWQAFRELYSNTLDENGETYVVESLEEINLRDDRTYIVISGEEFAKEYDDRARNFLPDGLTVKQQDSKLQVLDRPSNHVYYRGMRVYDLDKPSQFTYNFLEDVELTEDRTAKNFWWIKTRIEQHILESGDASMVERAVNAPEGTLESELSYTNHYVEPSETFAKAVAAKPTANPTAAALMRKQTVRGAMKHPLAGRPRPWRADANGYIVDRDEDPVLKWDVAGGLTQHELAYAVMLLQKNLDDWEIERYLETRDGVTEDSGQNSSSELEDVPF